jgi:hypothetical protein
MLLQWELPKLVPSFASTFPLGRILMPMHAREIYVEENSSLGSRSLVVSGAKPFILTLIIGLPSFSASLANERLYLGQFRIRLIDKYDHCFFWNLSRQFGII